MTQDQARPPMIAKDKRSTETPPQAAPAHARQIDCDGAHAASAGAHPGRTPAPRAARVPGDGVGRRRPRR